MTRFAVGGTWGAVNTPWLYVGPAAGAWAHAAVPSNSPIETQPRPAPSFKRNARRAESQSRESCIMDVSGEVRYRNEYASGVFMTAAVRFVKAASVATSIRGSTGVTP